jgi:hypothetical protein
MKGDHAMNDQSYSAAHDIPIGARSAGRRPETDSTSAIDDKRLDAIVHSKAAVGHDAAGS